MAKYSYELKKKVVQEYLDAKAGYKCLAKRNGIANKCILQNWVKAHKEFVIAET